MEEFPTSDRLTSMKTHNIVAAVMLLLVSLPVFAKGRIERIVITGPGLDKPVDVSDPAILQKLNPWFGNFVGDKGQAPAPKADDSTYEVLFYMRWPQRHSEFDLGELKLIYHVTYHPGAEAETGRIYFPGSNDKYHVNTGTILRDGIDGTWQWASVGWEETMRQLKIISKPPHPATTAVSNLTGSIFYKTLQLVILGLVVLTILSGLAWRRFVIANSVFTKKSNSAECPGILQQC